MPKRRNLAKEKREARKQQLQAKGKDAADRLREQQEKENAVLRTDAPAAPGKAAAQKKAPKKHPLRNYLAEAPEPAPIRPKELPAGKLGNLRYDAPFTLFITALTPFHLGSGQADVNVDAEIIHDALGFPYFPAKRLKGLLYESGLEVAEMSELSGLPLMDRAAWDTLFQHGTDGASQVTLDDLRLETYDAIADDWRYLETRYPGLFQPQDVLEACTSIRYQTKIDPTTGIAADTSLHNMRVLEAGCTFQGRITIRPGMEGAWKMMALAIRNLTRAGQKRTRGFGKLACLLVQDGRDAGRVLVTETLKETNAKGAI